MIWSNGLQAKLFGKIVVLPVRFNMLHLGHEAYIKAVLRCQPSAVYVFFGRSNAFRIETDPFDDVERRCMLQSFAATLPASDAAKLQIFPVFNRRTGPIVWSNEEVNAWYGYCADLLDRRGLRQWDVVISGNNYTNAYDGDIVFVSSYDLVSPEDQVFVDDDVPVSATHVRGLLYAGDEAWSRYVSGQTARIVRGQLRAFPRVCGPLDGVRHWVTIRGNDFDGHRLDYSCAVVDGQFKDRVVADALETLIADIGGVARIQPSPSEPYGISGLIERNGRCFDARVDLRVVAPLPDSSDLEYIFDANIRERGSKGVEAVMTESQS